VAYDGKVGIGTKSPTNALSVAGNANVNGYLGVGTTSPSKSLDIEQFLNE